MTLPFPSDASEGTVNDPGSVSKADATKQEGWIAACVQVNGNSEVSPVKLYRFMPVSSFKCEGHDMVTSFFGAPCATHLQVPRYVDNLLDTHRPRVSLVS